MPFYYVVIKAYRMILDGNAYPRGSMLAVNKWCERRYGERFWNWL